MAAYGKQYNAVKYSILQSLQDAANKYYEERLGKEQYEEWHERYYGPLYSEIEYIENIGWFSKRIIFASKKLHVNTIFHLPSAMPQRYIGDQTYLVKYNNGEITDQIWLTDYIKHSKSSSPYRGIDSAILAWPDGREMAGHSNIGRYYVTNFERTFICKLMGCNLMSFPGHCNSYRWYNGVFCMRCGNAAYLSPNMPIDGQYQNIPISELPLPKKARPLPIPRPPAPEIIME